MTLLAVILFSNLSFGCEDIPTLLEDTKNEIDGIPLEIRPQSKTAKFNPNIPPDGSVPANPLGTYGGPMNLSVNVPGFRPHSRIPSTDFALQMNQAVEEVAGLIQHQQMPSAEVALEKLATARKEIEGSKVHGVLRKANDSNLYTPISGYYYDFLPEAKSKLNGMGEFVQKGTIPGNPPVEIELTRIRTAEFATQNKLREDVIQDYVLMVNQYEVDVYWRHSSIDNLPKIMNHVEGMFAKAIAKSTTQAEAIDLAARIHWWVINATPYKRGSSAISDALAKSILNAKGIRPGPWALGISPDIKAFHFSEAEFVACYKANCGPPCPNLQCFFKP